MRTFHDRDGVQWRVWRVEPQHPLYRDRRRSEGEAGREGEERRRGDIQQGWLCFEGGGERRRLYPIPAEWEGCSDTRLELLRRMALPTPRGRPDEGG